MSEREMDQGQHERLCAYVFGELQGEERAAFERELAGSVELRAERARLEATVALVKTAVPDERLSPLAKSDLVASARRSRFRLLGRRPLQLLVAALVLVVGAAAALRFTNRRTLEVLDVRDGGRVALAPEGELRFKERTLDLDAATPARRAAGDGGARPEADSSLEDKVTRADPVTLEALEALGYGGDSEELSRTNELAFDALSVAPTAGMPQESLPGRPGTPGAAGPTSPATVMLAKLEEAAPIPLSGLHGGAPGAPGVSPQTLVTGSEGWFLGQGETKSGQYRGPGDSPPPDSKDQESMPALNLQPDGQGILKRQALSDPDQTAAVEVERYLIDQARMGGGETPLLPRRDSLEFQYVEKIRAIAEAKGIRVWKPEEAPTAEGLARTVDELLVSLRVASGESPRDMFFRWFGDAPFVLASEERISTFAADVDTASYALARSYLNAGQLPPREAIRTEEFVNYFKADQPAPTGGEPFALGLELAPSLFAQDPRTEILRVTLRARDVADFERKPVALTLVIDNSGSMEEGGRLELVKRALGLLLRELYPGDSVAVVKFSQEASLVTATLPATRRGELEDLIRALPIEGGTNVEAGLRLGFEQARANLQRNAINRVVLCSDGVGNIGETEATALLALVAEARAAGVYLNTVGVGMGNHDDAFLEELADKGDGVCNYVDSEAEARRVFVDGLARTFQPVARDVKIQVEFDPAQVERWRLLGYENRALRTQDFRNDALDAGEVNAGHQVSALYELVRNPGSGPVATARVRFKPPFAIDEGRAGERAAADNEVARELERRIGGTDVRAGFAAGSAGLRRSVLVAQFAEVLRRSEHAREDSYARLLQEAQTLEKELGEADFSGFVALLGQANPLLDALAQQETPRVQTLSDELARLHYEEALAARQRELAAEAGEKSALDDDSAGPLGRAETRPADARRQEIERLEAELRTELGRLLVPAPRVR